LVNWLSGYKNFLFKVFKIKTALSVHTPMVFRFFGSLAVAKIDLKVVACFYEMKPLPTYSEGPY
jgi:hypothetical protein